MVSFLVGCSRDNPVASSDPNSIEFDGLLAKKGIADYLQAPDGLVDVAWQNETVQFWPYTGNDFSGATQDPISLVFVGEADPMQIRAALLSLDGNRPDFHPVFPFTATWSEAIGNVQTGYATGGGWAGAVIQLELGGYETMRIHLRLIDCGQLFGSGGSWTIGAAHFEFTIPGTAEHQVLSWELAERLVVSDLERSGLLDPGSVPPTQTDVINAEPFYHDIPDAIYKRIPDELKVLAGLTPGSTGAPVPISTDGKATILHLVQSVPVEAETRVQSFIVEFDQVIPKPLCSDGPLDFILLQGPLSIDKTVRVDKSGRYRYDSTISGRLTAVPVDVTQDPPAPAGEPFLAIVKDEQQGVLKEDFARVTFDTWRIAPLETGAEKLITKLKVSTKGKSHYDSSMQCLGPEQ
jgi:hypothetical protein